MDKDRIVELARAVAEAWQSPNFVDFPATSRTVFGAALENLCEAFKPPPKPLPCPFCGRQPQVDANGAIMCRGPVGKRLDHLVVADHVADWNDRR